MAGRVLIVAGSDSGGGAGIQADIKTVTALGGYAMTAITALTAQDTVRVHAIHEVPLDFIQQQMRVCIDDIGVDCVKTGMLSNGRVIEAVVEVLEEAHPRAPLVVDPVMVSKGGSALLSPEANEALKTRLLPGLATVLTPNIPEAEMLTGMRITDLDSMKVAAGILLDLGPEAVLLKGGHMADEHVVDMLFDHDGMELIEHERFSHGNTHGTGCTLASAIATGIAQGLTLRDAVLRGIEYVTEGIRQAPALGKGHGPLAHGHAIPPYPRTDRLAVRRA
ncbi:bifunctional hydroxymethylpyrimidine kinase/phosphomethylpyrimidine kinase [Oceanibacterium hippocampi]|uniref:hydroxymethylpyrimidine kinase n=1 Tax=Oceanibacterium hippocampi TaxID=745714 RepID=A0A1Y5U0Q1_9PROT|nr:bifunctional hydroxymethylpyrimidine kinase/phosphomethylpyrimidine kinase [Oceanibacterium hippocampi]SLN73279.1 Hydroxymethylpyrimidine/phosphomethylpyrimidine kinase [Oceanibacterium hippocampi]